LPDFDWGKCLFDSDREGTLENLWCLVITVEVKSVDCLLLDYAGCEGSCLRASFARLQRVTNMQALLSGFYISTITVI